VIVSASWSVPAGHPALAGHFPGQPIVPGVMLLAEVARLARAELGLNEGALRWLRVKFLSPVEPDQRVTIALDGSAEQFSFRVSTGAGQMVATGQAKRGPLA